MGKYTGLLKADYKNIKRDPILGVLAIVPFIILMLFRFGMPLLSAYWPDVDAYKEVILMLFSLLNAMFPAFILAFIILDEKDLGILPVLFATPISLWGMLKLRVGFIVLFGFLASLMLIVFNGHCFYKPLQVVVFALLSSLSGPIVTLLIVAFAKNKVEGLTLLKLANVSLFVPLLAVFVQSSFEWFLCVFPAFWVFHLLDAQFNFYLTAIAGIIVLVLMNYYVFKFTVRRLVR